MLLQWPDGTILPSAHTGPWRAIGSFSAWQHVCVKGWMDAGVQRPSQSKKRSWQRFLWQPAEGISGLAITHDTATKQLHDSVILTHFYSSLKFSDVTWCCRSSTETAHQPPLRLMWFLPRHSLASFQLARLTARNAAARRSSSRRNVGTKVAA